MWHSSSHTPPLISKSLGPQLTTKRSNSRERHPRTSWFKSRTRAERASKRQCMEIGLLETRQALIRPTFISPPLSWVNKTRLSIATMPTLLPMNTTTEVAIKSIVTVPHWALKGSKNRLIMQKSIQISIKNKQWKRYCLRTQLSQTLREVQVNRKILVWLLVCEVSPIRGQWFAISFSQRCRESSESSSIKSMGSLFGRMTTMTRFHHQVCPCLSLKILKILKPTMQALCA